MSLMPFIYLRYTSPILVIKASLFFIMQTLSPNTLSFVVELCLDQVNAYYYHTSI